MPNLVTLAAGQLTETDRLTINHDRRAGTVRVTWPDLPTDVTADDLDQLAEQVTELLAQARIALAFRDR